MKKLILFFLTVLFFISCDKDVDLNGYQIVAHRGYWKASEGAQNSIRALEEAVRLNIDGVELDVRMTKDGHLILHHDAKAGKFTIAEASLSEIRTLRLPDGSLIPTLDEYFDAAKNNDVALYIDVKTIESIKPIIEMVTQYDLVGRTILLTSFEIGLAAISYNQTIKVHCIYGDKNPIELKERGFTGMAYDITFMQNHVDWICLAHSVGLTVGSYVIKSESEIIWCSVNDVDYITTDSPLECKHYLYQ